MSAYRGHLTTVVGDGPEVVIKLSGNEVRVLTPDGRVHTWPSSDVRVTGISGDRFWIAFQGEIAVFAPEHPEEFMLEFLPGLKTARTVADAIAAANADRDDSDPHPEAFVATPIAEPDDEEPPRVVAHRARLPQLSDHVAANGNGTTSDALASYRDPEPVQDESAATGRRWWSRGQTPPPLRPEPNGAPAGPEDITVDLTEAPLEATISAAVERAGQTENAPSEETSLPKAQSDLLRALADRKQASDAGRRGTYKPKR